MCSMIQLNNARGLEIGTQTNVVALASVLTCIYLLVVILRGTL